MRAPAVRLDRLHCSHLEASLEWFNDPTLARMLGRKRTISRAEHHAWFEQVQRDGEPYFAIVRRHDEVHIGNVWLANVIRQVSAELRIVIGEPGGINTGLGTEAIEQACEYGFDTLHLKSIRAFVFDFNARARRAFEKAGFTAAASHAGRETDAPGQVPLVLWRNDTGNGSRSTGARSTAR